MALSRNSSNGRPVTPAVNALRRRLVLLVWRAAFQAHARRDPVTRFRLLKSCWFIGLDFSGKQSSGFLFEDTFQHFHLPSVEAKLTSAIVWRGWRKNK